MLFQVLCGFEPIFYTTHPNEEPYFIKLNVDGLMRGDYQSRMYGCGDK